MNAASAEPHPTGLAETTGAAPGPEPQRKSHWTRKRWLTVIAFIFAVHVALIFVFGGRKPIVSREVANVPQLALANDANELLALNDPTLFALPHQTDFASAIRLQAAGFQQPSFRWTEPPRWLPSPSADDLGLMLNQFMQTNVFAGLELQLKPPLKFSAPAVPVEPALAQNSSLRVEGELAQRLLPSPISLTNWPFADVIAPSRVQVTVNTAGNVISAVLLPPEGGLTAADQYDQADQRALELARALRFSPSSHLTIGRVMFNWHTVPPPPQSHESETPANP